MIDKRNVERAKRGQLPSCDGGENRPMYEFFRGHKRERFSISFKELGSKRRSGELPNTSKKTSWWEFRSGLDDRHGKHRYYHALAWLTAGWRIEDLNIAKEQVVFVPFDL